MKTLRVLLWLSDFGGGGAQRTMLNLASALPAHGVAVELVTGASEGPATAWLDGALQRRSLNSTSLTAAFPSLVRTIGSLVPDAVLSTMLDANVAAYLAVRLARVDTAVILRETNSHRARADIGPLRRTLARMAYRRADGVIALSEGVRRELIVDMNLAPSHVKTIPNPVKLSEIAQLTAGARVLPIPEGFRDDARNVLAIGRLHRQKGYDLLIDAMAAQTGGARLVILGEGPDRAALQAQAGRLGLADRVHMPGFVQDAGPYLAHADLFVLSSRWEGFGHVIVEAMAAGLPVIATDCPYGPADIVRHDETGLLVPADDAAALASAIGELLADRRRAIGLARAAIVAARRFQIDRVAGEYAAAIGEVVRRRSEQASGTNRPRAL